MTTGMPAQNRAVGRPIDLEGGAIIIQFLLKEKGLLQSCSRGSSKIFPRYLERNTKKEHSA